MRPELFHHILSGSVSSRPQLTLARQRLQPRLPLLAVCTVPPDPGRSRPCTSRAFVTAIGSIPFLKQLGPGIRPCLTVCPPFNIFNHAGCTY